MPTFRWALQIDYLFHKTTGARMPDMNRTSASASAAIEETSAQKPTKARWFVLVLISFMYLITYMDRSNISVAAPGITKEFGLSKTAMGWVFSAFTLAYAIGQFPSGWLGDRIGPRKVLTVIMFWWAIAAVSTGAAIGFVTLLCARFLLGLGEAGAFPVATRGMQLWFPKVERGRIQGITHCFSRFAVAITPFVAVGIMTAFGWRAIFYIFGSLGAVWAAVFGITYLNRPEDHKGVNKLELAYIRGVNADGSIKQLEAGNRRNISWKVILRSPKTCGTSPLLTDVFSTAPIFSDLVSDLFAGVPPFFDSLIRFCRIPASIRRNDWRSGWRFHQRPGLSEDWQTEACETCCGSAWISRFGPHVDSNGAHAQRLDRGPVSRHFFFLSGTGDWPGVGRADGCGWGVQRNSK